MRYLPCLTLKMLCAWESFVLEPGLEHGVELPQAMYYLAKRKVS